MNTNCFLYLGLVLVLVVCDCSVADPEVNENVNTLLNDTSSSNKKANGLDLVSNSSDVSQEQKGEGDQVTKPKKDANDDTIKNNASSQPGDNDTKNMKKNNEGTSKESQVKKSDDKQKEKASNSVKPKEVPKTKDKDNGEDLTTPRKDGSHAEECDPSNKCTDEEDKLVACLRVPGNESPDLSLLVQNKGKGPLSVTIIAPDFVKLEETKIQLPQKQNKKVKVSITDSGSGNLIVLKAGNGYCRLDINDLIAHSFGKDLDNSQKSTYKNFLPRTPIIAVVIFAALLVVASGWMCLSFRKKRLSGNDAKYQRLDMELPVSGGGKKEPVINDGWDNNWGDDWDDEEAPNTPSMPVTPSLSSKGLASRRLSKEGWKD